MKLWPVIIDSQPSYLRGRGRSGSLLLAPVGTSVLVEHVAAALSAVTDNAPLVVAPEQTDPRYREWIRALYPAAQVVDSPAAFADALAQHELSDALLFIDPRCMPADGFDVSPLVKLFTAEPRVAHHLVAFDRGTAGTKERVCFDTNGHVRSIQRFYDQATWAFIAGIMATLAPCACGLVADDVIPRSLAELRQMLIHCGVPSRDVPIEANALDLGEEHGMLAANERLTLAAAAARPDGSVSLPVCVGSGQAIHPSARMMGPVVVHPDAFIDSRATVLGPAVVGAGARINAGAVVAHAIIGPDSVVPANLVVRDRVWFRSAGEHISTATERPPMSYTELLARLSLDADHQPPVAHQLREGAYRRYLTLKRALDVCAAVAGLALTSPLFLIISAAIWLESGGPVFYGDKREGLRGRVFKCWKFRTMYTGAHLAQHVFKDLDHTDGPHFKVDHDPRVTRVGRILRALNLDEIPQLFNVLSGQMSLVGPRPSPFRENQVCVSWRAARLSVRPGITGFWQVCRHNRSAGDFHQWIEYDLLYVQHLRFLLDLKILAATMLTLGGKAAHVQPAWLIGTQWTDALKASSRSSTRGRGRGWQAEAAGAERSERELVAGS